jgi:hypothetical protein
MGSRWPSVLAAAVSFAAPLRAQQVKELGFQLTGTASSPALAVAGPYAALRTSERTRLSFDAGAGVAGGEAAWRAELLAHFLLDPMGRSRAGLYGAGGVAVAGGPSKREYLVLTLGLEGRPGDRSGWFVEGGVGGGVRIAAGLRRRWFPRPDFAAQ